MSRYDKIEIIDNNFEEYNDLLRKKNLKKITQYSTFNFNELQNINDYNLTIAYHRVEPFEKIFMISQKYYGSPEYGWLICYTNKLPNETRIKTGDVLRIYLPLPRLLELL